MIRLLLLGWLAAHSQEDTGAPEAPGPSPEAPAEPPRAPMPPETLEPVTLSGARANYPTIVESYIFQNSKNEMLSLKDKSGKRWRLQLERVDLAPMRELKSGHFVSCVLMRDGPNRLDVDFTVDFSGSRWRVSAINVHKVNGKPRFKYKGSERVPR